MPYKTISKDRKIFYPESIINKAINSSLLEDGTPTVNMMNRTFTNLNSNTRISLLTENNEKVKDIKLILNDLKLSNGQFINSSRNQNVEEQQSAYSNRDTKSFLYNNNSFQKFNTLKINRPGTSSIKSTATRASKEFEKR